MVALPEVTSPTVAAIEAAVVAAAERGDDLVVRASSIGEPCEARLWFKFRWAHDPEQFSGRMLRLFDTGNVEEARMIAWLRAAGVTVEDVDPETGKQWRFTSLGGHFSGSCDGKATGILEAPKAVHLAEFKTHNAKSFAQLVKHGVEVSHPKHVAQMQIYMHKLGLTRSFYLAENKDTSELKPQRLEYNAATGIALEAKAERVIRAPRVLARISDDPNSFNCRGCPANAVCHGEAFGRNNCRTCIYSTPIIGDGDGAVWRCERFGKRLTVEDQKAGCPAHLYLPELVPGEQIDAGDDWVEYRLANGTTWRDGVAAEAAE
jgi:hypothetical protein